MRLPPDTAAEKCVLGVLHRLKSGSSVPARELAEVKTMMYSAGVDGWTWIQVLLVDYLYLGRERVLGHCMVHNAEWTDAQKEVLKVFQRNARLFCEGDPTVAIGPWHEVSETVGRTLQWERVAQVLQAHLGSHSSIGPKTWGGCENLTDRRAAGKAPKKFGESGSYQDSR